VLENKRLKKSLPTVKICGSLLSGLAGNFSASEVVEKKRVKIIFEKSEDFP